MAFKKHWRIVGNSSGGGGGGGGGPKIEALAATTLKKSELNSQLLPAAEKRAVAQGTVLALAVPAADFDAENLLVDLLPAPGHPVV
jgi:hypothetical protein